MPIPISSHTFARLLLALPDMPQIIIGQTTPNIGEQPLSTELLTNLRYAGKESTLYVDDEETVGRMTVDSILDDVLGPDAAEFKKHLDNNQS
jgi:hypothetical protein